MGCAMNPFYDTEYFLYHYSDNKVNYTGIRGSTAGYGVNSNHSKPLIIIATNNSTDLLIAEMYMKNENVNVKW